MIQGIEAFYALICRDMAVFWPGWKGRFINALIWATLMVGVFEMIMPKMGLQGVGQFMAAGAIASWGFFEVTENIARFIADLHGEKSISYYLTLPMRQWAVFVRIAITNALQAMFISILFLPIFKLMLYKTFTFAQFSIVKFSVIFLLAHLFYGFFSLYIASQLESIEKMGNVWLRIVYPLWWLGCFQFSWKTLYAISPTIAYINLLNPLVYIMEATRSAIMGPDAFLPFWYSAGVLILFTFVIGAIGIKKLKARLDCL